MEQSKKTAAPKVLLVVCGGIAAYKAVEVLRGLQHADCEARVLCTADALEFVGRATWEGLVHHKVATSLYDDPESAIPHVWLAGWADVVVVVPATANIMAKMVCGLADDLASTTLLAVPQQTPIVLAPAMNTHMWLSPATRHNVDVLRSRGVCMVLPVSGRLACDAVGDGKLAPVDDIVSGILVAVSSINASMVGKHVLITAGPTHEAIDPVRYIANASSGKMGYALAREAALRGARVTLVSGPVSLDAPGGVERVDVVSAQQMYDAATRVFMDADVAICAAAVADYTPAHPAGHKLKKDRERLETIQLTQTKDILAQLCATKGQAGRRRFVVGFAAETNDLVTNAQSKLERKGCDLIVANDVSRADSGFGSDTNHVSLVCSQGVEELPTMSKQEVAARVMDRVQVLLEQGEGQTL